MYQSVAPRRWATRTFLRLGLVLGFAGLASTVFAQGLVEVGAGSRIDSGGGSIQLGCASLEVQGVAAGQWSDIENVTLGWAARLETSELDFGGSWTAVSDQQVPGQVRWRQQCGRDLGDMRGNNRFDMLSVTATTGALRRLDASAEQVVDGSLLLSGGATPLLLRSTVAGQAAALTVSPTADWSVQGIDLADIDSSAGQPMAPGDPADYQSQDSGGNRNWFLGAIAIPVPVLGLPGLLLFSLLILGGVWRHFRSQSRALEQPGGYS